MIKKTNLTAFAWTKDKKMRFLSCCENTASAAGMDSPADMLGKSDFDVIWRDRASQYFPADQAALNGKTYRTIELVTTKSMTLRISTIKSPLYNKQNRIVGIVGCNIDITDKSIIHHPGRFDKKGFLHLDQLFSNEYLTRQEVKVLRWLLHGYSSTRIAEKLNLSFRTVENYLHNIKIKFQCKTKGDLISIIVESGLFHLLLSE